MSAIIPLNQKKCRETTMLSQLPQSVTEKRKLKKLLKKAQLIADKYELEHPAFETEEDDDFMNEN